MDKIKEAAGIIKSGGIVIYPTDTAFGIGCRIDNEESIKRLFEARKRPETQAVPVLFDSIARVEQYVENISEEVRDKLLGKHWPGALTVIFKAKAEKVPPLVRGGGETIGARIPDHETIQKLIELSDVPILGPSANFHGESTPFKYEDLDPELIKMVDFVLEGNTKGQAASTVIDTTVLPWKIIREGAVKIDE
jgi:L-threonylcarbamoyladenylate synthase